MEKKNWLFGQHDRSQVLAVLGLLLVLIGFAYLAQVGWHKLFIASYDRLMSQDQTLDADFDYPEGWEVGSIFKGNVAFWSKDLRYSCSDGGMYSRVAMEGLWLAAGDDSELGPCFRAPIAAGSEVNVSNSGDVGLTRPTLSSIPGDSTDGNQRDTVKNVEYIRVDGYEAVRWEDSYGDSPVNNLNVVILKGREIYSIDQSWAYGEPNPYPNVVDDIVASFKFKD